MGPAGLQEQAGTKRASGSGYRPSIPIGSDEVDICESSQWAPQQLVIKINDVRDGLVASSRTMPAGKTFINFLSDGFAAHRK